MPPLTFVSPEIEQYATGHSDAEPRHLAEVAKRTQAELSARSMMMVGHLEGAVLAMFVRVSGAKRILEIGTFTGYSALWMAEALPDDGSIITCDLSEAHASVARDAFAASPHAAKIDFRFGPAIDTIATLDGPFDLVFIDADKTSYAAYYDATLPLLSDTGVILVDNVLWSGRVVDGSSDDPDTAALIAFNDMVAADQRVNKVLLPIRDGITVITRAS